MITNIIISLLRSGAFVGSFKANEIGEVTENVDNDGIVVLDVDFVVVENKVVVVDVDGDEYVDADVDVDLDVEVEVE